MKKLELSMDRYTSIPKTKLNERQELIGMFLVALNSCRKPPYKPLKAARVGVMLRYVETKALRAFYGECNAASNFHSYYFWRFKQAKNQPG